MAKTYTLNDLGVTIDDLILLQSTGYEFDENEGITEERREEVLAKIYEAKQTRKSPKKETRNFADLVPSATVEQAKQVKYDAKNGKEVSLQDMASVVKAETIINKDLRDQLPNVIKSAVEKDSLTPEETAALGYLLDELNGKHVEDKKNPHSIHEYNKRFADMPELLEQAAQKVEEASVTVVPAVEKTYTKEEIEELLTAGEVYLMKPTEAFGKEGEKENVADAHNDGFEKHATKMSALIKDYGEGKVDVAPDALLDMDKLVALYGKEYARGKLFKNSMSYDVTQDAADAAQRVAFEKKLHGIKTPVEEEKVVVTPIKEVEEENKPTEEKEEYSKEEIAEAMKKKPADRSLRDWIIIKHAIQNHPTQTEGQKAYALKSLTDQARTYKMKDPKKTTDEELKDADEFMQEFGYDYDKKGRAVTNPIARRWKDAIDKRIKALEAKEDEKEDIKKEDIKKEEDKKEDKGPTVIPVIIPHNKGEEENIVTPSDDNRPTPPKEEEKKKKGLFGWIGEKAKKVGDWAKRNWKKIAIGGAILAATLFGAKSCENGEKDDVKKDNIEVVTPTPTPEKITESKDTIDLAMAHQYCKRMGYQDSMSQEDAIAKYLIDRETYSIAKDKYASHMGIDNLSTDAQMAILATVRGNIPNNAPVIDAILNARDVNIASAAKLKSETAKFVVNKENGTIQYSNPEEFTKQTGKQSIDVDKGELKKQVENAGFIAQARGGNSGY
ncbi:MAG: hypothetical protein J6K16_01400 [Alphaproteobacteria bacterium]|nr:hypothetical protein [Alphaproteobacteria bacterium]